MATSLNIHAENQYRDEIDKARYKHADEIIEYAAKPCYIALFNNTKILQYAENETEMRETIKRFISQFAIQTLTNKVKVTNADYRSNMYHRYVDYCIEKFKPVVEKLVRKAKAERRLK